MRLKKVLSLILCVCMVLGTMSTVAFAADTIDVSKAVDGVITLESGTYGWSSALAGKTLTLKAAEDADVVFEMGSAQYNLNGANITFEGITFNWAANGWPYHGLTTCGDMVYSDCTINGTVFLYGDSNTFTGCTFDVSGDTYNVWTYGSKKTAFDGCTFKNDGKAILIYNEGAEVDSVSVDGCRFISSAAMSDKAAIEIGTTIFGKDIEVDIADCKLEGAGYGSETLSGSALVNQKDGDEAAVTVDGEYVTGAYVTDANGEETYYSSVYEAIAAAPEGSTVDILGSVYYNPTRYPGTSKDTAWKRISNKENITINGNGHTIKTDSVDTTSNDGALLSKASNITVNDLTVVLPGTTEKEMPRFITLDSGELNNVTIKGGTFALSIVGDGEVTINDCNFENIEGWAIETEGQAKTATLTIKDSTFDENAVIIRSENNTFEGNTITGSGEGVNVLGDAVISGNNFGESSLGIDSGLDVEIKNNVIETVELTTWLLTEGGEPDYSNVEIGSNKLGDAAVATLKTIDETVESAELVAVVDGTDYYSMADAIAAIKADSEMTIYEGTYSDVLKINKANVTVKASGEVKFTSYPKFTKGASNFYVEGIDFEYEGDGSHLFDYSSGTIKDCNFTTDGSTLRWCYAEKDSKIVLDGCTFTTGDPRTKWAVHFDSLNNSELIIKDCTLNGHLALSGDTDKVITVSDTDITGGWANTYSEVLYNDCDFDVSRHIFTGYAGTKSTFNNCTVEGGKEIVDVLFSSSKQATVIVDGEIATVAAVIGDEIYTSIKAAVLAANPGDVIVVEGNFNEKVVIEAPDPAVAALALNDAIVIDLNGNTLNGYIHIEDANKVIEVKNGNIVNTDTEQNAIESIGDITLTNLNIKSARGVVNVDGGKVTINSGNYTLITTAGMTQNVVAAENAEVTINGGVFVGPAGTASDSGAAVSAKTGSVVTINNGKFSGGKVHTLSKADTATLVVNGGLFDQDVTAYVVEDSEVVKLGDDEGYEYPYIIAPKAASAIKVEFAETDTAGVYDIVLVSADGRKIHEFVSAEFTFSNTSTTVGGSTMQYAVSGIEGKTTAQKAAEEGKENQYIISIPANGERLSSGEVTKSITIGQVKFIGQGTINFSIANGEVDTTWQNTNLGRYYYSNDGTLDIADADIENGSVEDITRDVVVKVTYNHDLVAAWDNNEITVTLKDGFGEIVGTDDISDGIATFEDVRISRITVTLEAPGFRKYVYETTLEEGSTPLVLNFWNDVKKDAYKLPIETGKTPVAHNFVVGDIVMDYIVDKYDLAAVTSYYGMYDIENNAKYLKYDLNRDGNIDIRDVQYVLHTMGN